MSERLLFDIDNVSKEIANRWKPLLLEKRNKQEVDFSEAAFCGLVAFAGIQMCLWPIWRSFCELRGATLNPENISFDLSEALESDSPWLCINLAYGKNVLLSHVQVEGVNQNRDHIKSFLHSSFSHMFRSLGAQGEMIQYDNAVTTLVQMGYTDYEVLAFTVEPWEALPEVSQFAKVQKASTKKIPVVSLDALENEWDFWQALAEEAKKALGDVLSETNFATWQEEDVCSTYHQLAAMLWKELVEQKVLLPNGAETHVRSWFRKPSQDQYRGNVLFYGDHEAFWQRYRSNTCDSKGRGII